MAATILIVDDTYSSREPIARLLRHEGYTTVCAENGRVALEMLKTQRVDLILLDLMMPEMDGVTFLGHLRGDPKLRGLPVIVASALCFGEAIHQARHLGVAEFLLKSRFTFKDLLKAVRSSLTPIAVPQVASCQLLVTSQRCTGN